MPWERWIDTDFSQIYEVAGRVGVALKCFKGHERFSCRFEAKDADTYNVFMEVRYVRVATRGGLATPVRPVEGGWEIWSTVEKT